ncbi:hypothetical protein KC950_03475 [Candidatus Saccharibacteria bacterium]|nr:hypothetical protein [Candidatus Saccharibacteria bacterium]
MSEQLSLTPGELAYRYISPEIVASHGEEIIVPALKMARAVLSIYHPDISNRGDNELHTRSEGEIALSELNLLLKQFETDELHIDDVAEQSTRIINKNRAENFSDAIESASVYKSIQAQIQSHPITTSESGNSTDIVATGETVFGDQRLPRLILSKKVIDLIGKADSNQSAVMVQRISKGIRNLGIEHPLGFTLSEWNQALDSLLDNNVEEVDDNNTLDAIEDMTKKESFQRFSAIVRQLMPGQEIHYDYPENWYRSQSGTLVLPSQREEWPNYEQISIVESGSPEIGPIDVYSLQEGIITQGVQLNPQNREFTLPFNKMEMAQKKALQAIIDFAAIKINYNKSEFVEKNEGQNDITTPMDFIFRVGADGLISVLYARPNSERNLIKDGAPLTLSKSQRKIIQEGYYMVKAGKDASSGKYALTETPLALIKLEEGEADLGYLTDGSAFAMAIPEQYHENDSSEVEFLFDTSSMGAKFTRGGTKRYTSHKILSDLVKYYGTDMEEVLSFPKSSSLNVNNEINMVVLLDKRGGFIVKTCLEHHKGVFLQENNN